MYEDYFKSVIGGNFNSPEYYAPTYENKVYDAIQVNSLPGYNYSNSENNKVEDLYPDIYNVVSPMIDKIISTKNIDFINEETLNSMTIEIYDVLEADDVITTNVNLNKNINSNLNGNMNSNLNNTINNNSKNTVNKSENNLNKTVKIGQNTVSTNSNIDDNKTLNVNARCRNCKNPLLRDLIKILILNKINNKPPYRPPFIPRPIPNYRDVSTEVFRPYNNYSKTYFDTPYPEEG